MKRTAGVVAMMAVALLVVAAAVGAEEVRGRFVKRVERAHGDGEFLGVVVQLPEEKGQVTLLVPRRREDLAKQVQRLKEGQVVEVTYVTEGDAKWVRTVEVAGRPEPKAAEGEEMERLLRRLLERIERLEREVRELRQQAERDRAARREGEGDRDREGGERLRIERREGEGDRERTERREGDREGDKPARTERREGEGDREGTEREREGDRKDREAAEGNRREGDREREGGEKELEGRGELRGRFVRLAEQKLGRVEHLCVIVQPDERDAAVTLFVPMQRTERGWVRDERIAGLARKLRAGQRVEVTWRRAEGQRFIVNIEW